MGIGEKIKQQRKLSGLSQEKLGGQVGVSLKTIQRWENGERSPRIEEIKNLAGALNTSVEYLMGVDNTKDVESKIKSSSINNSVESNNDLDLVYWGGVAERAGRAARSGDIQKLTLVAALLQSALNAITSAGVNLVPHVVGVNGNHNSVRDIVNVAGAV